MGAALPRITMYKPASVGLSAFGMSRPLPEGLKDRAQRASTRFDFETMFFDVFRTADGAVLCMGPPLEGCAPRNTAMRFSRADGRSTFAHRVEAPRISQQLTSRLYVRDRGAAGDALILEVAGISLPITTNPSHARLLSDRRVIMTLCKDTPPRWIHDWAAFHVRIHGADAVLLYDNGSTSHALEDIAQALSAIAGLKEVVIVDWPFRYGIGSRSGEPVLDNFCQTGALDHARRCFCLHARSVLNADIDELLPPGDLPIFEQVETSSHAAMLFYGIWAEAPDIESLDDITRVRHRDCSFVWRSQTNMLALGKNETLCRTKWIAVPNRCGPHVEWGVHDVYPASLWARTTRRRWRTLNRSVVYRHCRQINTGWKTDRWRSSANFDHVCSLDHEMAQAFSLVFGEFAGGPAIG